MLEQPGFSVSAGQDLAWTANKPPPDEWASAFPLAMPDYPTEELPVELPEELPETSASVAPWHSSGYTGDTPELVDGPFDGLLDGAGDLLGSLGGLFGSLGPSIASMIGGWPFALAAILGFKLLKTWQEKRPAPVTFVTYAAPAGQAQQLANYLSASGVRVGQVDQESNNVVVPVYHRGVADRAIAAYNGKAGSGAQITRVGA